MFSERARALGQIRPLLETKLPGSYEQWNSSWSASYPPLHHSWWLARSQYNCRPMVSSYLQLASCRNHVYRWFLKLRYCHSDNFSLYLSASSKTEDTIILLVGLSFHNFVSTLNTLEEEVCSIMVIIDRHHRYKGFRLSFILRVQMRIACRDSKISLRFSFQLVCTFILSFSFYCLPDRAGLRT